MSCMFQYEGRTQRRVTCLVHCSLFFCHRAPLTVVKKKRKTAVSTAQLPMCAICACVLCACFRIVLSTQYFKLDDVHARVHVSENSSSCPCSTSHFPFALNSVRVFGRESLWLLMHFLLYLLHSLMHFKCHVRILAK